MLASFLFFLACFVAVGVSSFFFSKKDKQDYYLASHSVSPALVGLSAVATNNSGYMFIGLIGYVYTVGLQSIWLMLGWILGDFIASTFVHRRLQKATLRTGQVSYAGVLSGWNSDSDGKSMVSLQKVIGLLSLLFLMAYASAQLVAGAKAMQVLLEWPLWYGAVLGAVLVLLYCVAGGLRASIWTDVAQSLVMISAMALLLYSVTDSVGGFDAGLEKMRAIDGYMNWFPAEMIFPGALGALMFVLGWAMAGFQVIGQPHIMVRFMALANSNSPGGNTGAMVKARAWYYLWFLLFWGMATAVGLFARIHLGFDSGTEFDTELALPTLAQSLLSPVFVGLILAGLFAATMSTADSLVLSCSAAISNDLAPKPIQNTVVIKFTTVVVTLAALTWALFNSASVFNLVILAWSGLGSAFGALLLVLCFGGRPSEKTAIAMVLAGIMVALSWRYFDLHNLVYEGLPGVVVGFVIFGFGKVKRLFSGAA